MKTTYPDDMFNHFIRGMDEKMQAQLSLYYAHQKNIDKHNQRLELEKMKREITEDVLSRISLSVDTQEILHKIKDLQDTIDQLGK